MIDGCLLHDAATFNVKIDCSSSVENNAAPLGASLQFSPAAKSHEQRHRAGWLRPHACDSYHEIGLLGVEHSKPVHLPRIQLILNNVETGFCGPFDKDRSLDHLCIGLQRSQLIAYKLSLEANCSNTRELPCPEFLIATIALRYQGSCFAEVPPIVPSCASAASLTGKKTCQLGSN